MFFMILTEMIQQAMPLLARPPELLAEYQKKLDVYSCTVPVFEQYVLTELLNSGDFERHINRVRRHKRKEKESLSAIDII